jgi:DNA-binding Lrp family transcriptional regulator
MEDISLIRELQKDVYLEVDPFQRIADSLGRPLNEIIERVKELKARGAIRRFGAALTPVKAGFKTNAMVVWDAEGADGARAGETMASHPRVSHCYIRPSFEGFPYTLYTMIHADSGGELQGIINELGQRSGLGRYRVLKTVRELKKTSPVYFG